MHAWAKLTAFNGHNNLEDEYFCRIIRNMFRKLLLYPPLRYLHPSNVTPNTCLVLLFIPLIFIVTFVSKLFTTLLNLTKALK